MNAVLRLNPVLRYGVFAGALALLAILLVLLQPWARAVTNTWTGAGFDQGTYQGTENVGGQLQLGAVGSTFPLLWIANAGEDTVSKYDSNTGKEIGRYRTWFNVGIHGPWNGPAPSRTAVDADGNVYVANRHFDGRKPLVLKILSTGGIDRNGNGIIETSTDSDGNGVISSGEMKPLVDSNGNGKIDTAELQDERIVWAVEVGGAGQLGRALCIAPDNNIYLGTYGNGKMYKISSADGSLLAGPYDIGGNPYGCVVDPQGNVWTANLSNYTKKLVPSTGAVGGPYYHIGTNYGIAYGNGRVYLANLSGRTYAEFNPNTNTFSYPAWSKGVGVNGIGISVAPNGDIIVSQQYGGVRRFKSDGTQVWFGPSQTGTGEARGAGVDANGDVWVNHLSSNNISKFNGATGAPLGVFPAGVSPYTYSDFTGQGLLTQVTQTGFWTVIYDSGGTKWGIISWDASVPPGAALEVSARAAETEAGLDLKNYQVVSNGVPFSDEGRFIQIRVKLVANEAGQSPVLNTITVESLLENQPPTADAGGPYSVAEGGSVALSGSGSDPDGDPLTYAWDLDNDGSFETAGQNPTFSAAGRDGPDSQTVVLQVCDDKNACATDNATVNIDNVAPTADAGGPYAVAEGGSVGLSGSGSDPGPDALTYAWDLDNDGTFETAGQNPTFAGLDGPSSHTVVLQVCDDDGACATDEATVNVSNEAPVVNAGPDVSNYSGQTHQLNATFSDKGTADTHTATINWGDGSQPEAGVVSETNGSGSVSGSHVYYIPGNYTIAVTVVDDDGGTGSDSLVKTVNRLPVQIDIKPGSFPNSINLKNKGNVPVGVFTGTYEGVPFDATALVRSSLDFAGAPDLGIGKSPQDLDGDGDLDQVFHFDTQKLNLTQASTEACLTGQTAGNIYFQGCDSVRIVK